MIKIYLLIIFKNLFFSITRRKNIQIKKVKYKILSNQKTHFNNKMTKLHLKIEYFSYFFF